MIFEDIPIVDSLNFTYAESLKSPWFLLPVLCLVSENSDSKFSGLAFKTLKTFLASSFIVRACKMKGLINNIFYSTKIETINSPRCNAIPA